jgi:hypothetical protein
MMCDVICDSCHEPIAQGDRVSMQDFEGIVELHQNCLWGPQTLMGNDDA